MRRHSQCVARLTGMTRPVGTVGVEFVAARPGNWAALVRDLVLL